VRLLWAVVNNRKRTIQKITDSAYTTPWVLPALRLLLSLHTYKITYYPNAYAYHSHSAPRKL